MTSVDTDMHGRVCGPPRRRLVRRAVVAMWVSVPAMGVLGWWLREYALAHGAPCEERGWQGCAIDGGVTAAIVVAAGVLVAAVTSTAIAVITRLRPSVSPRVLLLVLVCGWVLWAVACAALFYGALTG